MDKERGIHLFMPGELEGTEENQKNKDLNLSPDEMIVLRLLKKYGVTRCERAMESNTVYCYIGKNGQFASLWPELDLTPSLSPSQVIDLEPIVFGDERSGV